MPLFPYVDMPYVLPMYSYVFYHVIGNCTWRSIFLISSKRSLRFGSLTWTYFFTDLPHRLSPTNPRLYKPINYDCFFFSEKKWEIFVFQTEPNSIDRFWTQRKPPSQIPKKHCFIPLSPTRLRPEKKCSSAFFHNDKIFDSTPTVDYNTRLLLKKMALVSPTAREKFARRRRRFPARARNRFSALAAAEKPPLPPA